MIRRLADVARDNADRRRFVTLLLDHHAAGGKWTRKAWRAAQRQWEDTVEALLHGRDLSLAEAEYRAINLLVRFILVESLLNAEAPAGTATIAPPPGARPRAATTNRAGTGAGPAAPQDAQPPAQDAHPDPQAGPSEQQQPAAGETS